MILQRPFAHSDQNVIASSFGRMRRRSFSSTTDQRLSSIMSKASARIAGRPHFQKRWWTSTQTYSVHSTSVPLFEELGRQSGNRYWPLGEIPSNARRTLGYLKLLSSPDWKNEVESRIRKPTKDEWGRENYEDFRWAVEVARQRELPFLLDALAERGRSTPPLDSRGDLKDIALSIYAELGGELTAYEVGRFRPNGFCGDPEERLLEIAAQEKLR